MPINTLKEEIAKCKRNIRWNEREIEQYQAEVEKKASDNARFEHRTICLNEAIRRLGE